MSNRKLHNALAPLLLLALSWPAAGQAPLQPEVNDPPKFEKVTVDFAVAAGNLPGVDTDEPRTCVRTPVTISFLVVDPDGGKVTVTVDDDGDGVFNDFKKTAKAGSAIVLKKKFAAPGPVPLRYRACDAGGLCTGILKLSFSMVACPPVVVEFATGSERVGVGDKAHMTLRARDAQEDPVRWEIDWDDDGVFEQVTKKGKPSRRVTVTHAFTTPGAHVVSARCCDDEGCSATQRRTLSVKALGDTG
jgi:hypothetical protein